jgi:hypothetical protein
MRKRQIALLLAIAAGIALSACGGAMCVPAASPTAPPQQCVYPSGVAPAMVYPAEGTINVPDNLQVVVSDRASSLSAWLPNSGNSYYADPLTQPWPFETESIFNGPQSVGFTLQSNNGSTIELSSGPFTGGGTVTSRTHYYVYLEYAYNNDSGNQCYANGPIGDFTTQ